MNYLINIFQAIPKNHCFIKIKKEIYEDPIKLSSNPKKLNYKFNIKNLTHLRAIPENIMSRPKFPQYTILSNEFFSLITRCQGDCAGNAPAPDKGGGDVH